MVTNVGAAKLAATVSPTCVDTPATTPAMGAWIWVYPSSISADRSRASASATCAEATISVDRSRASASATCAGAMSKARLTRSNSARAMRPFSINCVERLYSAAA